MTAYFKQTRRQILLCRSYSSMQIKTTGFHKKKINWNMHPNRTKCGVIMKVMHLSLRKMSKTASKKLVFKNKISIISQLLLKMKFRENDQIFLNLLKISIILIYFINSFKFDLNRLLDELHGVLGFW